MIGEIGDKEFEEWIVYQMDRYVKARVAWGYKRKGFQPSKLVPGFKHTSARKQIDYKVRKMLNDESKHGVKTVQKLIQQGQLGEKINKNKIPEEFY